MNRARIAPLYLSLLLLPACSGGGGGATGSAGNPNNPQPGGSAVHVVIDTAGGQDAVVQAQVIAATLQRGDGSQTGNLLTAPRLLRLNDPSGEAEGLELRGAGADDYVGMHLVLAPGSGGALLPDGTTVPVTFADHDLSIGFEDNLHHGTVDDNWVHVRHGGRSQLAGGSGGRSWSPAFLGGPAGDSALSAMPMTVAGIGQTGLSTTLLGDDRGMLHVEFEHGTELFDDHGGRIADPAAWLAAVGQNREISLLGAFDDRGGVRGRRLRSSANADNPRLLGRITAVDPATRSFDLSVFAEALRGTRRTLPAPEPVHVDAAAARFHFSHTFAVLAFGDLHVGDMVKVAWTTRTATAATAREVELVARLGAPMGPETEGMVQSVDLVAQTVTVVPRHNDPLWVGGQQVAQVVVALQGHTLLTRKARSGGARTTITLAGITPGTDRIWLRGVVTGAGAMTADWIRVRQD